MQNTRLASSAAFIPMMIVRYRALCRRDFSDYGISDTEAQLSISQGIVHFQTSIILCTGLVPSIICSSTLLNFSPGFWSIIVQASEAKGLSVENDGLEC